MTYEDAIISSAMDEVMYQKTCLKHLEEQKQCLENVTGYNKLLEMRKSFLKIAENTLEDITRNI